MNEEQILKSLVKDKSLVNYHYDWGFYIKTDFESIHMIGLIPKGDYLELSLFFGDTQSQSRSFYRQNPRIDHLTDTKWKLSGNFHFSSTFQNLIWFDTGIGPKEYIKFWEKNVNLLYQHSKEDIPQLINLLSKNEIIILDEKKKRELDFNVYNKEYQVLNVCAGFGAIYRLKRTEAEDLYRSGQLQDFLIKKINDGLSIIGENGNNFLNSSFSSKEGDPPGF